MSQLYTYFVTSAPGGATHAALRCKLTKGSDQDYLVCLKTHCIDVYSLEKIADQEAAASSGRKTYGPILTATLSAHTNLLTFAEYRPPGAEQSHLLVVTANLLMLLLTYDGEASRFIVRPVVSLQEPTGQEIEAEVLLRVDPNYNLILFHGLRKIIKCVVLDHNDYFQFNHMITMRTGENIFIDALFVESVYRSAGNGPPGVYFAQNTGADNANFVPHSCKPPRGVKNGKYILECKMLLISSNRLVPCGPQPSEYWYSGIHVFFEVEYINGNRQFNAYGCSPLFGEPVRLRKQYNKFLPLKLNNGAAHYDSAMILGSQSLGFLSFRDPKHIRILYTDVSMGDITSYCSIEDNRRYLVGDNNGALYIFDLLTTRKPVSNALKRRAPDNVGTCNMANRVAPQATRNSVADLIVTKVGVYSPATTLIRISSDTIYIATHVGNCRTVRFSGLKEFGTVRPEEHSFIEIPGPRCHELESTETWKQSNLGPIMDLTFGEKRDGSSSCMLACCGYGSEGRICSISVGVGMNVLAAHIMEGARNVILVEDREEEEARQVVMCCIFFNYSKFFKLSIPISANLKNGKRSAIDIRNSGEWLITRIDPTKDGFAENERTVLLTKLDNNRLLQVTTSMIIVMDNVDYRRQTLKESVSEMCLSAGIASEVGVLVVNAIMCDSKLLLLLSDHHILMLEIDNIIRVLCFRRVQKQVSALAYISGNEVKNYECLGIIALCTWESSELYFLCPETFNYIYQTKLVCRFGIAVNAMRFVVVGHTVHLIVALSDGTLMLYLMRFGATEEEGGSEIRLLLKNIIRISDGCIGLVPINVLGDKRSELSCNLAWTNLVTTGSNPTLVYAKKGKIEFLRISTPYIHNLCWMSADADCCFGIPLMYIADKDQLCVGILDTADQLHVETICSGRSFDKICYHPESDLIVVGCAGELAVNADSAIGSKELISDANGTVFRCLSTGDSNECFPGMSRLNACAKFINLKNKEVVYTLQLPYRHIVASITTVQFEGHRNMVAIGTACMSESEEMPSEGHIYLVDVISSGVDNWEIAVLRTVTPMPSGIVEMSCCNQSLVMAMNDTVIVMSLSTEEPASTGELKFHRLEPLHTSDNGYGAVYLEQRAEYVSCTYIVSLATYKDIIVVGDLMNSVRMLQWNLEELQEISRDFNSMYCTAVAAVDQRRCIVADSSGNLCVFAKPQHVTNDKQADRVQDVGLFHHGENINKIVMNPEQMGGSLKAEVRITREMPEFETPTACEREFCCLKETSTCNQHVLSSAMVKGLTKPSTFWNYQFRNVFTCATSAGSLIQLCMFDDDKLFYRLSKLEEAINSLQSDIGNVVNNHWRTFKNKWVMSSTKGFIDGDVVESYLDLEPDVRQKIFDELHQHDKMGFFYSPELLMLEIEHIKRLRR